MSHIEPTPQDDNIMVDPVVAWERCMAIIEDNVSIRSFQTWFLPITAVELSANNILTIQVPSQFFYEWLEEHFVELLAKTIRRVLGRTGQLAYRIQMENNSKKSPATMQLPSNQQNKTNRGENYIEMPLSVEDPSRIKNPFVIPGMKRMQIDPQLNRSLNFDNFIEGECNTLCRNSAQHVAQKPGSAFNPLMIFGGTGCGKTHLIQAIGNEVRNIHPNKTVLYVSAEKFINQYIEHSRNREVGDFINFYQLIDVLLLDDIHIFTNAPKAQDALFAIFNHLHQTGKQIVLTSDTPPKDLDGMQERLLSRFRWGLTAEMMQPDFETRKSILNVIMRNEGTEISDEVAQYIAFNVQNNIRDLRGAVISILAQSTLLKKDIDLELAKRVVKNLVKTVEKELGIAEIQKMVCSYFKIDYDKLQAKTRTGDVVNARQIAMYLAKKFTKSSLKTIGDHFGKRDHTTVIHSVQKVEDFLKTDESYRESFLEIQHKVQLAAM